MKELWTFCRLNVIVLCNIWGLQINHRLHVLAPDIGCCFDSLIFLMEFFSPSFNLNCRRLWYNRICCFGPFWYIITSSNHMVTKTRWLWRPNCSAITATTPFSSKRHHDTKPLFWRSNPKNQNWVLGKGNKVWRGVGK